MQRELTNKNTAAVRIRVKAVDRMRHFKTAVLVARLRSARPQLLAELPDHCFDRADSVHVEEFFTPAKLSAVIQEGRIKFPGDTIFRRSR